MRPPFWVDSRMGTWKTKCKWPHRTLGGSQFEVGLVFLLDPLLDREYPETGHYPRKALTMPPFVGMVSCVPNRYSVP